MISHEHKCIFIHIPKTAGTSINAFFHPEKTFDNSVPDYDSLYGWCPERKIYLQHATSRQLVDTNLISPEDWSTYYKFTFVRNPWDRAYSDYLWFQKYSGVKGTFKEYIYEKGEFEPILKDNSTSRYRGDHVMPQISFFDFSGKYSLDYVGRFEHFSDDIGKILSCIEVSKSFKTHANKSNRKKDYSAFYTNSMKKLVTQKYQDDIKALNYSFEDNRKGINFFKKFI